MENSEHDAGDVDYGEDVSITPFDATAGIAFKHGRLYSDRARQVSEFEKTTGFEIPQDFLEMLGEYCEGGFDGRSKYFTLFPSFDFLFAFFAHFAVNKSERQALVHPVVAAEDLFSVESGDVFGAVLG
jgi:hypothetical protein